MKTKLITLLCVIIGGGAIAACQSTYSPVNRAEGSDTYQVNPHYKQGIETAKQVNAMLTPEPAKSAVNIGLAVAGYALAGAAAIGNAVASKRAADNKKLLLTVTDGVEKFAAENELGAQKLKSTITQKATSAGVEVALNKLVAERY